MGAIELWWIGASAADEALLTAVGSRVSAVFGAPSAVPSGIERPAGTLDARRGQHASARILSWLAGRPGADRVRRLAVTDVDLFMPVLTFVFGEAQLGGRTAVVSTARLATHGGHVPEVLLDRLAKEAVHELGHTFGLLHCDRPSCVMHRSASLRDVDAKGWRPCPECRRRLGEIAGEERSHVQPSTHASPGRG